MCRSVYVGGSCFWDCGSGLRIRACWLLCGDGSNLEAVLAPRRLLEFKRRQGPRAVLGFLEELGFGRWISSHRLRNGCVVDRAVSRPSDDSIPSLPTDAGARTAVSMESLQRALRDPQRARDALIAEAESEQHAHFIAVFLAGNMRRSPAPAPVLRNGVAEEIKCLGHRSKIPAMKKTSPWRPCVIWPAHFD